MVNEAPLVSVVIPAYNSAEYLLESLQSILNQTYRNLEVFIMDDTPDDDGTYNIIKKFNDSRVFYIKSEKRLGLVRSLNEGIRLSHGVFIARMDTDDIAHVERIERQVKYLLTHKDVGVVGSSCYTIDSDGRFVGYISFPSQDVEIKAKLLFNSAFVHSSVIIRRELILQHPYSEKCSCCEDYELWSRLASKTKFHNLDEKLIKYRLISQSAMSMQLQQLQEDNNYYLRHTAILKMAYDNMLDYYGRSGIELHKAYVDLLFAKKIINYSIHDREIFLKQCQEMLSDSCPKEYLRSCIAYQWIKMARSRFIFAKNKQWIFDAFKELVTHAVLTCRIRLLRLSRHDSKGLSWRL